MDKLTRQVLQAARDLISDPARWAQDHAAYDAEGRAYTTGTARGAVRWCALGALSKVSADRTRGLSTQRLMQNATIELDTQLLRLGLTVTVDVYNDTHDHRDVLALFDGALNAA